MLIVVSGLPGTGKSAIADGLGRELRLPVVGDIERVQPAFA
jgi:predicted kinase